jgi:hydrogenase maturation protease
MELLDDPSLVILIDTVSRGGIPGTLYTLEVDCEVVNPSGVEFQNAHGLDPARVLGIALQLGAHPQRVLVIGCEPETLEDDTGTIGLTPAVETAVGPAIEMIHRLIEEQNQSWAIQTTKTEVCA